MTSTRIGGDDWSAWPFGELLGGGASIPAVNLKTGSGSAVVDASLMGFGISLLASRIDWVCCIGADSDA